MIRIPCFGSRRHGSALYPVPGGYGAYSRNGTATEFSLESLLAVPQKRCASRVRTS